MTITINWQIIVVILPINNSIITSERDVEILFVLIMFENLCNICCDFQHFFILRVKMRVVLKLYFNPIPPLAKIAILAPFNDPIELKILTYGEPSQSFWGLKMTKRRVSIPELIDYYGYQQL